MKKRQSGENGAKETLPPNMPKGKTKTAVIALAFAIKPKIGMRIFVNLNDFTVWRAELITPFRKKPIFLTTFSGRPPKEEAMLAIALNRIYTPILRQQIPEIVDFFLPMEALSYKLAVISIDKAYPGQAKRAAMAFWSALPQFTYTKFVVIVDSSINVRDPRQVVWVCLSEFVSSCVDFEY